MHTAYNNSFLQIILLFVALWLVECRCSLYRVVCVCVCVVCIVVALDDVVASILTLILPFSFGLTQLYSLIGVFPFIPVFILPLGVFSFYSILEIAKNNYHYTFTALSISESESVCVWIYVLFIFFSEIFSVVSILIVVVIISAHFNCQCLKCISQHRINIALCRISILSPDNFTFGLWCGWIFTNNRPLQSKNIDRYL